MAKQINKAYIKFKLKKEDTEFVQIRFHSVIFEDHEVKNDITYRICTDKIPLSYI